MRHALEQGLGFLIVFFSATELGRHFWPDSALIYGIRVDYLSPTLYMLDLLMIIYLFIKLKLEHSLKIENWNLEIIVPLLLVNLLFSANPLATLSWSLHLLLYAVFILSLSSNFLSTIPYILVASALFQVALGAIQVALGHSLQGILYWFGERAIAVGAPTVATASFFGHTMLRAYGTFSHPNVLAGWLVIASLITVRLVGLQRPRSANTAGVRRSDLAAFMATRLDLVGTLAIILAALGVFLTESRTAAFALFGIVIPCCLLRSLRVRILYFFVLLVSLLPLLSSGTLTRSLDLSVFDRLRLQNTSFSIIRSYPIFGSGASASISTYPAVTPTLRLLQPDHDAFTLFLSWFGFAGIVSVAQLLKIGNWKSEIVQALPLLPLLLLDHYFLTSPQGLFVLLLYFRIVWKTDKPANRLAD